MAIGWSLSRGSPLVGDLVALHDPAEPERLLVKRVVAVLPAGLEVRGDNQAASRDSRAFGLVEPSRLIGKVVYRYFPPARAWVSPAVRLEQRYARSRWPCTRRILTGCWSLS